MLKKLFVVVGVSLVPVIASADWHKCFVTEVGQMDKKRIYVACKTNSSDSSGAITRFAVSIGSTDLEREKGNRLFTMGQTALVSGRPMGLYWPAGARNTTINCINDCRVLDDFNLYAD